MNPKAKNFSKDYVVLTPKGEAEGWAANSFWKMAFDKSHPKNTKKMGYLVSGYEFDKDWDSWENHPNGDEIVYCASGSMTFVLEIKGQTQKVRIKAGEYVVVPKNTWHTAKVRNKCKILAITWGFGTKHRSSEDLVMKRKKQGLAKHR